MKEKNRPKPEAKKPKETSKTTPVKAPEPSKISDLKSQPKK